MNQKTIVAKVLEEQKQESQATNAKNLQFRVKVVNPNVDEAGLKALEEKYNCTTSQILLGYILNQDFETLPLAGASKIEQLEDFIIR